MLHARQLRKPTLFILAISAIGLTVSWQQFFVSQTGNNLMLGHNVSEETRPNYTDIDPEFVADSNGITLHSKAVLNMNLSEIIPPYYHLGGLYFTAPRYQLATCAIQKNMATIQWTLFCFLKDPAKFVASNRTITSSKKWDGSLCSSDHYGPGLPKTMEALGPNMTLFTVIRHPIDRFLSGYTDRCLVNTRFKEDERCFGCRSDLRCFVEKLHKTLIDYYYDSADTSDVVQHLVNHFAPQTWYCEFEKYRKNYILINYHLGPNGTKRIAEELDAVLAKAHVEAEFREIILREITSGRTPHSTRNTEMRRELRRKLLSDDYLMRHIMEMYFYDFTNLGFV